MPDQPLAQCPICGAPRAYSKFEQRWVCSVDPEHGEAETPPPDSEEGRKP